MKFFFHSIRKQFTLFNFNFSFNYKLNSIDQFFKIRLNIKNFKKNFQGKSFLAYNGRHKFIFTLQ
jgi:hypothetical protein